MERIKGKSFIEDNRRKNKREYSRTDQLEEGQKGRPKKRWIDNIDKDLRRISQWVRQRRWEKRVGVYCERIPGPLCAAELRVMTRKIIVHKTTCS